MSYYIEEVSREFLAGAIELLSELIDNDIEIVNFSMSEVSAEEISTVISGDNLVLPVVFDEGLKGSHAFVLSKELAASLVALMMGEDVTAGTELTEESKANIVDAFSQLAVVIANSLSMNLNMNVQSRLDSPEESLDAVIPSMGDQNLLVVSQNLAINGLTGKIEYIMPASIKDVSAQEQSAASEPQTEPDIQQPEIEQVEEETVDQSIVNLTEHIDDIIDSKPELEHFDRQDLGEDDKQLVAQDKETKKPEFSALEASSLEELSPNINLLMDVPLQVTVELGRTKMPIKEVLEISEGSIIELNKLAGEPVDFYVNGKLISKGEVVVIDENFGIRITEIVTPVERITSL